jgi:hypothetical protein
MSDEQSDHELLVVHVFDILYLGSQDALCDGFCSNFWTAFKLILYGEIHRNGSVELGNHGEKVRNNSVP